MAQTRRITHNATSPSTEYGQGADIVAQSWAGNYSVLRVSATAFNRGTSSSQWSGTIVHTGAVDGYGQVQHAQALTSGYPQGAVRWDAVADVTVHHDAAGNHGGVTLRQTVSGGSHTNVQAIGLSGFARIPKRPAPGGAPVISQVLPTSVMVNWSPSPDNGGAGIDGYLLRYWTNAEGSGNYIDHSFGPYGERSVTGLTPGQNYRFVVYAHNGAADNGGYSNPSGATVVRTLSGMWAKYQGIWRRIIPFVKVSGVWRAVSVFIKYSGAWKRGG